MWLNGEFLGEHRDGFLPFEFEIDQKLRWDGENALVLSVDNAHHEGDVPGMHVGWRGYGGILREVSLAATDPLHIATVRVIAAPGAQGGEMELHLQVRNVRPAAVRCSMDATIRDADGKVCATLSSGPVALASGAAAEVALKGTLPDALVWSPSTPVLYRAQTRLVVNDEVIDEVETRFGFRRIQATPDALLLNGKPVFLTGFNYHEDSPRTAMAVDLETARRDLEAMKEAGANFVRLCHYPHHPAKLDMCDEIGLLVFAEVPLYFWNDAGEGRRTNAARVQTAARQMEQMIARDFNHPSIVFWSVSNETHEEEPEVAQSNRELIRQAKALDPTRLHVHVSNRWKGNAEFEADDVICINDYPSIEWPAGGHNPATFDLSYSVDSWRTNLAALRRQYPTKPVLVTEFGYCSFAGTHGHSFGEDEHSRVIEREFAALDAPFLCGTIIWCWADHPWPAGRFFGGLSISPFGVLSRDRRKLKPFWTARALFHAKQNLETGRRPSSAGSTTVVMVRPDMNGILQVPFPDGYGIRSMTTDDIGLWTDIQRDAEPYLQITDSTFREEFGDDMGALQRRCYIVTDPKGLGIGTISAWYERDFRGQDYGRIHWVALRPSCQGKGLAKAALSYAMNRLAQWHNGSYLVTSTERIPAIKLYLDFGFKPDFSSADVLAQWRDLSIRLKHPALEQALTGPRDSRAM